MRHRPALAAALVAATLAGPGPARAADPIMPLKDVRPGMECTGLSVVRGTAISEFEVEVIDVIRSDGTLSGPRILFRVSGPAVASSGIGPGFSGSPVMCPDSAGRVRNAGAISEGVGEYGNDLGLATPIESILGQRPAAPRRSRRAPRLLRRARRLASPLTVSGLGAPLRRALARAASGAGQPLLAAPAGPQAGFPVQDLRPGAAVSVGLSSGDIAVGGIGTVTYRDGSALWAFGHPFDGVGRRSLLLSDAYVFTVVDNPLGFEGSSTYKLAAPGHTVGAIINDTDSAVIGRVGRPPRTIAMKVSARDLDTGRTSIVRSRVTDERHLELGSALDLVSSVSTAQAMSEAVGSSPPLLTSSVCLRIALRERSRPLGYCNRYLDATQPFLDLSTALALIDDYQFGRITPTAVTVSMRTRRGAPQAFILGARAPRRVAPGRRMRVRLALQRSRGSRFSRSFTVRVPGHLRPGRRILTIRGVKPVSLEEGGEEIFELLFGEELDGFGGNGVGARSVDALAARIAGLHRADGLRATFARRGRGAVVLRTPELLIRGRVRVPVVVSRRGR